MSTFGLTAAGYTAPRMADYLSAIRTDLNARLAALGQTEPPDYARDTFAGQITEIMAKMLGELGDGNQAVYDARRLANATGIQLEDLCILIRVFRIEATPSQVTLRCSGTDGTAILQGKVAQGGGEFDTARWVCAEDGIIGQTTSGYVDLLFKAQEPGPTVATAGQIDQIVTPVSGWTSVTNLASATPGQARETNAALRARRQRSLFALGSTSCAAILGNLLTLVDEEGDPVVTSAVVVDNITGTDATIDGISVEAFSVAPVVAPSTLSASQQQLVADTIFARVAGGTRTSGTVTATVTKLDGRDHPVKFSLATDATVDVSLVLTLEPGYVLDDVSEPLEALVADYFLTLALGATVYPLTMCTLAGTLDGIADVTGILLNGSAFPATHNANQQPVLGTFTAT